MWAADMLIKKIYFKYTETDFWFSLQCVRFQSCILIENGGGPRRTFIAAHSADGAFLNSSSRSVSKGGRKRLASGALAFEHQHYQSNYQRLSCIETIFSKLRDWRYSATIVVDASLSLP